MLEQRVIQPQHQKWIAKLLGYDFQVVYRPGLENEAADALSCIPPSMHLAHLSAPTIVDVEVIKFEVEAETKLKDVKRLQLEL